MNDNSGWSAVPGENNVYDTTLSCPDDLTALSVGANGGGALNNIIAMAVVGAQNAGYYRVRVQAGSQPADVTAQLVCARVS